MPAKKDALESDIDDLFQKPLAEFTTSRNALAARLKKEGRAIDAERVKSLPKPPATAWAVNQLYWQKSKAIEQLLDIGERIRKAQTGKTKNVDVRELLEEKKRMTMALTEEAGTTLSAAGHAASHDALRRVSTTLDALAVWGKTDGTPKAGRLTADLDAPGFDALAAVLGGAKITSGTILPFRAPKAKEDPAVAKARAREVMQTAEKALREARREAERADGALAKANARVAEVEKKKEEIEARYAEAKEAARLAANEAKTNAQSVAQAERSLTRAKEDME